MQYVLDGSKKDDLILDVRSSHIIIDDVGPEQITFSLTVL